MGRACGALKVAIRGKRGQKLMLDIVRALDALPKKELGSDVFEDSCAVCTLGAVAKYRGQTLRDHNPMVYEGEAEEADAKAVSERMDIAPSLAREVMYENDIPWGSDAERWESMRNWAISRMRPETRRELGE